MRSLDRARRGLLKSAAGLLPLAVGSTRAGLAGAHERVGAVLPPKPVPAIEVTRVADGRNDRLDAALRGKVTAVQLMFTGCSATCPIQGAQFAELSQLLAKAPPALQLLSVSIDPLGDDLKSMRAWLKNFSADPVRWTAVVPAMAAVDPLIDFLNGRANSVDRHTPQVYLFDVLGQLVYRTPDLPAARLVATVMSKLADQR